MSGDNSICPCGLSKELCLDKHKNIDISLADIRTDQRRARDEYSSLVKEAEARQKEYTEICESHMIERLHHQAEIAREITDNIKASYRDAVEKVVQGLNLHRKDIDSNECRIDALEEEVPSNAISRMVSLEDWRKLTPEDLVSNVKSLNVWRWILTGLGLAQGVLLVMMWKYFDRLAVHYDTSIKVAEDLIKSLGGKVP